MVQIGDFVEGLVVKKKNPNFVFWDRTRIVVLILSVTCLTLLQINSQIFTFTVICMDDLNNANNTAEPHWIESTTKKSILFSTTAVGALVGLGPSVPLLHNFGVRKMFTSCGLISTLGTLLFPISVSFNFYAVCFCRFLQGLGISISLTLVGVIPNAWAPKTEASTFLAVLSTAWQLSNIVFMPVSGVLCDSFLGWRSIYYIFGAASFIFMILFFIFYEDLPNTHKNVSAEELIKIESDKTSHVKEAVPYKKVCTDHCVLAAWIGFFGGNIGFIVLLLYGPTYLRDVLHFDVQGTGWANGLPYLLCAIYKMIAGKISDKITFVTEKTKYTAQMLSSVSGLTVGYLAMAMTSNRSIAQFAFTFAIVTSGLRIVGSIRCLQLRCRQHTHFAMAVVSLISYLVQFLAPILVGFVCPQNTPEQWSRLFIIVTVAMIVAFIPFPFLTTSEPADYTIHKAEIRARSISCENGNNL